MHSTEYSAIPMPSFFRCCRGMRGAWWFARSTASSANSLRALCPQRPPPTKAALPPPPKVYSLMWRPTVLLFLTLNWEITIYNLTVHLLVYSLSMSLTSAYFPIVSYHVEVNFFQFDIYYSELWHSDIMYSTCLIPICCMLAASKTILVQFELLMRFSFISGVI